MDWGNPRTALPSPFSQCQIRFFIVVCILSPSLSRSFVLLICNLNINLLDRPSSLATLAEFSFVGFTLIVLSISSCNWSASLRSVKFSLLWNSFCHIALISDSKATLSDCSFSHWRMKCSTFSSAAPHSRHVGSVSFRQYLMRFVCSTYVPVTSLNFTGIHSTDV